jgi:hypothetical protein
VTHRFAWLAGLALVLAPAASQAQAPVSRSEILDVVRAAGFRPVGTAGRDGGNYVVRAIDRYGDDVQIIVNAEDAEVLYVRRFRGAMRSDFAGPRTVQGPRYPDFYGNVPRPPRTVPATRATAPGTRAVAAGPPVPRPRPGDVTGSVGSAPASSEPAAAPAAPAKTAPAAPAKPDVPPVVGFE